jgi:hypothetical protein
MSRTRIPPDGKYWTIALLLVLALALPACASSGEEPPSVDEDVVEDRVVDSKPQPEAGVATPERAGTAQAGTAQDLSETVVPPEDFDRKIVKTAELGVTSEDVRGEAAAAQQVVARFGGTIVSSQTYRSGDTLYADLILSVPSEHFEDALEELRGLGEEVRTDTVSGQDVTEEYVDLQSRERNLLAAEQSLLDLYNRAGDVQDALSIQSQLTGVRGEIEQVHGRMQYLKHSSDMSQISLNIQPVSSPPKPPSAWDPALVVARAWNASLGVLQGLTAAVLSTLVFGWWIIPPLVLAAWWLRRRLRQGSLTPRPTEPE